MYLKETMVCAIEKEGIGTCHGDSGIYNRKLKLISEQLH